MQERAQARSGAGHGCFQALTIHLHLIKFSLLFAWNECGDRTNPD